MGGPGPSVRKKTLTFFFLFSHQTVLQSVQRRLFKDNYTFPRFQTPEEGSSADPEGGGGQGVRTPLENHKLYGFL